MNGRSTPFYRQLAAERREILREHLRHNDAEIARVLRKDH